MNKKQIAFFEVEKWEEDYLKKGLKDFKLLFFQDNLEEVDKKVIKDISVLSPFIYSKVDKKVIKDFSNLELVTTRSTGFDHINLKDCKKNNIKVTNVPFYGENTVAEHTFALILSISRKIHKAYERTSRGDFTLDGLRGFDLKGKTIGVIGGGHIGQHVIRMAKGFEMNVLVYDPFRNNKLAKRLGFKYTTLNSLLKNSDIITLHAPYNKKTHHLINLKNLKLIKDGAVLINTSRGGLIDTTALVKGLSSGKFSGLGLDVLEEEKFIIKEEIELLSSKFYNFAKKDSKKDLQTIVEGHILLKSDKVVVTPHSAFNSQEALERILDTTVDNIKSWYKKKKLKNLVK